MKNINILYIVSILLLSSSCASWSFKGKDTKYKVNSHIKVFMNKEPMKRQCKIFLNDHSFFSNEGNTSYANQPVILYTNEKKNYIRLISCNTGPTDLSSMSRQYHFSPGDIEFTVLDKENADLGDIEIHLFYAHKPYTGAHLASDLAFTKLTNKFSLTSTLYLAAVVKVGKNTQKNIDLKMNFKNGKTIKL